MTLIGSVDSLSDTCISGWAADDADFDRPVQVEIVVNSAPVATVPCTTFREDLLAAGIGDGRKGFRFDPSAHLTPGRNNLEVRHAGTDTVVPRGRGQWVKRRGGGIPAGDAAGLAAIEAYHEFKLEDHICGIGESAAKLQRIFVNAGIPFRKFTHLVTPAGVPEKVDLTIGVDCSPVDDPLSKLSLESVTEAKCLLAFATARPVAPPVLAHIHVPKCAGTSFRVLMERSLGPRHLSLYVNDTYFVYGDEALRSYLRWDPGIAALSSHHVRAFPHWLAGREMLYVTFLRDPIQQFVSYMTHIKKHYRTITSESLLESVPRNAHKLTLREFARWLLTQDRDIPFRENHNVNFFARHSAPGSRDRLEAAKAALAGFLCVGVTEHMEESMRQLRKRAQEAGIDFPAGATPVENTSADYRDDLDWIHPGDDVGALLLRSVALDQQLYNWALARLELTSSPPGTSPKPIATCPPQTAS